MSKKPGASPQRPQEMFPWVIRLALFLTVVIVASPAVTHATFLGDQVDQIVGFRALFQGRPVAFYGPVMSGTDPHVFALGPVCSTILGLPIALRLSPDVLHVLLIVTLACMVVVLYRSLERISRASALLWCSVILAAPLFWWASSLIWAAVIPVWFSIAGVGLLAHYSQTGSRWSAGLFLPCWVAGICAHLTFVVTVPLVAGFLWLVYRDRPWQRWQKPVSWIVFSSPLALLVPYCVGEAATGLGNTRAILAHLTQRAGSADHSTGYEAAFETLAVALDPLRLQWRSDWMLPNYLLVGWFLGLALLAVVSLHILGDKDQQDRRADVFWKIILAVYIAAIPLQMAFFWTVNRPLLSWHYTLALLPIYPVPYVIIARLVFSRLPRKAGLGAAAFVSLGLLTLGATTASSFFALDSWNYRQTTGALAAICTECSSVNTFEDDGAFIPPSGAYETVLNLLIKKYVPECRFSDRPELVLVPRRNGTMSSTVVQFGGREYRLRNVVPPGIGVYQ